MILIFKLLLLLLSSTSCSNYDWIFFLFAADIKVSKILYHLLTFFFINYCNFLAFFILSLFYNLLTLTILLIHSARDFIVSILILQISFSFTSFCLGILSNITYTSEFSSNSIDTYYWSNNLLAYIFKLQMNMLMSLWK